MDKQQILQLAQQDPNVAAAVDAIEQQVGDMPITSDGLAELIQMLEAALDNPQLYAEVVAAAVADGLVDPGDLPEQFDPTTIIALLVVMYELQGRTTQQGFARGGLAQLARSGRNGDTQLAHVNPREAAMLRAMGGSGSVNPHTGLREYSFLKSLFKVALPIALTFVAPGIGTAIGASMGATGAAASMLGSGVIGGTVAGLTGGNVLKGAMLGGLTAGAGDLVGGAANNAMGLGLGTTGQAVLGSGLAGAAAGALTGGNPLKGAAMGALGGYAGAAAQGAGSAAVGTGGKMFGNMLAAGYKPREALIGGGLSGLAAGISAGARSAPDINQGFKRPSEVVVEGLRAPNVGLNAPTAGGADYSFAQPGSASSAEFTGSGLQAAGLAAPGANIGTPSSSVSALNKFAPNVSPMQMLAGASTLSSLVSAPRDAQQAVQRMPAAQQEYFNRPSVQFDWNKMRADASASGTDLTQFMAQNWNRISSGQYNVPAQAKARGGALTAVKHFVEGAGSGREDAIHAKLSDGEYVMDAETVALLGDGSNKAGAQRLDAMRESLRAHKGKTLARGKFSPNAKSPLEYLKGAK